MVIHSGLDVQQCEALVVRLQTQTLRKYIRSMTWELWLQKDYHKSGGITTAIPLSLVVEVTRVYIPPMFFFTTVFSLMNLVSMISILGHCACNSGTCFTTNPLQVARVSKCLHFTIFESSLSSL